MALIDRVLEIAEDVLVGLIVAAVVRVFDWLRKVPIRRMLRRPRRHVAVARTAAVSVVGRNVSFNISDTSTSSDHVSVVVR